MEEPWEVRSNSSERSMRGELFDMEYELRNFSLHVPSDISFEERAFGGVTEDESGDLQDSDDSTDSDNFGGCNNDEDDDDFQDCNNYEEPGQVVEVTEDVSEVYDSVSVSEVDDSVSNGSEGCPVDSLGLSVALKTARLQKLAEILGWSFEEVAAEWGGFNKMKRPKNFAARAVDLREVDLEKEYEFEELNTEEDGPREEPEGGYVVEEKDASEEYATEEESEQMEEFIVATTFTEGGLLDGETRYGDTMGGSPKTPEMTPAKTHVRGVQKHDTIGDPISRQLTPYPDSLSES